MNVWKEPLNWVFSAPSHIAILRVLRHSQEGMSGRAIARGSGINHQTCANALKKLENLGIIERHGSGRTQWVRLNPEHFLVHEILAPLLRKEKQMETQIRNTIARTLKPCALSVTLFGSFIRNDNAPGGDIDILALVEKDRKAWALNQLRQLGLAIHQKYGARLTPLVLTVKQARARLQTNDSLLQHIFQEGIDLLTKKGREAIVSFRNAK